MKKLLIVVLLGLTATLPGCILSFEEPDPTTQLVKAYYVRYTVTDPNTGDMFSSEELPPTSFARIKREGNWQISLNFYVKDSPIPFGSNFLTQVDRKGVSLDSLRKYGYKDQFVLTNLFDYSKLGTLYIHANDKVTGQINYTAFDGRKVTLFLRE